jgi:hypothetical protein
MMSPPSDGSHRRSAWWLYYVLVAVLGIYGGVALFDWVAG